MSTLDTTQLLLNVDLAWHPTGRGGARPGAGRPVTRTGVSHDERSRITTHDPVHVTLRVVPGIPLRNERLARVIKASLRDSQSSAFSIAHYSIQDNHLHTIIEADDRPTLARGMIALSTRIARRVNRAFHRRGAVFSDRYHARGLATPTEVRNGLRYVLLNARHHVEQHGSRLPATWIDRHSSALAFDGWAAPIDQEHTFTWQPDDFTIVTRPARTWLLGHGWKRHGLLRFDEVPGKGAEFNRTR